MVLPKVLRVELLKVAPLITVIFKETFVQPLTVSVLMVGSPPVFDKTLAETITSSPTVGREVA